MRFPCKHQNCPGFIEFELDDERFKVIGNFNIQYMKDHSFDFNLKYVDTTLHVVKSLKIVQPDHAEFKEQVIFFNSDVYSISEKKKRFYLTCDGLDAHTLPYEISIKNV